MNVGEVFCNWIRRKLQTQDYIQYTGWQDGLLML